MYTRYQNNNGLTWMVNEDTTYNGKPACRVIYLGTKKSPAFEESIYCNFDDFYRMYGIGLKKVED